MARIKRSFRPAPLNRPSCRPSGPSRMSREVIRSTLQKATDDVLQCKKTIQSEFPSSLSSHRTESILCKTFRKPEADVDSSICYFRHWISLVNLPTELKNHAQIVGNKGMWVKRHIIAQLLPEKVQDELPFDCPEAVLVSFEIVGLRVQMTCYACMTQIGLLCSPHLGNTLLTKDVVRISPNRSLPLDPKCKKTQLGLTALRPATNPTTISVNENTICNVLTLLSRLQVTTLKRARQLLEIPMVQFMGAVVRRDGYDYLCCPQLGCMEAINTSFQEFKAAVIATEAGTGKTLMGLVLALEYVIALSNMTSGRPWSVVVVKPQLMGHWKAECKKHLHLDALARQDINVRFVSTKKHLKELKVLAGEPTVIILDTQFVDTAYSLLLLNAGMLIVDEGHAIPTSSQHARAMALLNHSCKRRVILTATPEQNLKNVLGLTGFPLEPFFEGLTVASTLGDKKLLQSLQKSGFAEATRSILHPLIIRGKHEAGTQHISTRLFPVPEQYKLMYAELAAWPYDKKEVKALLQKLSFPDFDAEPRLLRDSFQGQALSRAKKETLGDVEDTCGICMSVLVSPVQLGCGHIYCQRCLAAWWDVAETRTREQVFEFGEEEQQNRPVRRGCPTRCLNWESFALPSYCPWGVEGSSKQYALDLTVGMEEEEDKKQHYSEYPTHRRRGRPPSKQDKRPPKKSKNASYSSSDSVPEKPLRPRSPSPDPYPDARDQALQDMLQDLERGAQLLIYTQQPTKAHRLAQLCRKDGRTVETIGFGKAMERDKVDAFLHKKFQVGILNIRRYCEGVEFPAVANMLIMDFQSAHALTQACKRIGSSRLGSTVTDTNIQIAMYDVSMEQYLQEVSRHGKDSRGGPTVCTAKLPSAKQVLEMEYILTRDDTQTRMGKLCQLLEHLQCRKPCSYLDGLRFQVRTQQGRTHQEAVFMWGPRKNMVKIVCVLGTHTLRVVKAGTKAFDVGFQEILSDPTKIVL